jgi:hypothetical protein
MKLVSNGSLIMATIKKPYFHFGRKWVCEMFEFTIRIETVSGK